MKEAQVTVLTGTFLAYDGFDPPTRDSNGYWYGYPTEIDEANPVQAAQLAPPGTIYFYFLTLRLFPDDAALHLKNGRLERFFHPGDIASKSPRYYINCIPLKFEEAFPDRNRDNRGLRMAKHLFAASGCATEETDVQTGKRIAVMASNSRRHVLQPEDIIFSTREPYRDEFCTSPYI